MLAIGTDGLITPGIITPKLDAWTHNIVGLAAAMVLTPEATTEFTKNSGEYRVPVGTIRTFGTNLDLNAQSNARAHRMLSPRTLSSSEDWQIRNLLTTFARAPLQAQQLPGTLARWDRTFARLLNREMTTRIVVNRPIPSGSGRRIIQDTQELERIRSTLGVTDLSEPTLLAIVEAATAPSVDQTAVDAIDRRIQEMQQENEALEDELNHSKEAEWLARQDAVEADERAAEATNSLHNLQRLLHQKGLDPWAVAQEAENLTPEAPPVPGSWSDMADRADEWEEFGIYLTADRRNMCDMDTIDTDGRALNAAHEALAALAGYVRARRCGVHNQDFGRYLEIQPAGYPTYPRKRFVPTETNWTKQHHGQERQLPAPEWVNSSGIATMNAHLRLTKIPNRDPRLYFMDAVRPDGLFSVVVGYIGQHLINRASAALN